MNHLELIRRTVDEVELALAESFGHLIKNQQAYAEGVVRGMKMAVAVHSDPDLNSGEVIAWEASGLADRSQATSSESTEQLLDDHDKVIGLLMGSLAGARLIQVINVSEERGQ